MNATYTGPDGAAAKLREAGETLRAEFAEIQGDLAECVSVAPVAPMEVARDLTMHFLRPGDQAADKVARYYATVLDAVEHPERYGEKRPEDPPPDDPPPDDPVEDPPPDAVYILDVEGVDLSTQNEYRLPGRLPDAWRFEWVYSSGEPEDDGKAIIYTIGEWHDGTPWKGRRRLAIQAKRRGGKWSVHVGIGVGRQGGTDWDSRKAIDLDGFDEILAGHVALAGQKLRLGLGWRPKKDEVSIDIPAGALDGVTVFQVSHRDIKGSGSDGKGDEPMPKGSVGNFRLMEVGVAQLERAMPTDPDPEELLALTEKAFRAPLTRSRSSVSGDPGSGYHAWVNAFGPQHLYGGCIVDPMAGSRDPGAAACRMAHMALDYAPHARFHLYTKIRSWQLASKGSARFTEDQARKAVWPTEVAPLVVGVPWNGASPEVMDTDFDALWEGLRARFTIDAVTMVETHVSGDGQALDADDVVRLIWSTARDLMRYQLTIDLREGRREGRKTRLVKWFEGQKS